MYVTGVNMATSEEQDKLVSSSNDGQTMQINDEVNRLSRIYKNEHVLSDSASSMETKVRALISTWNELAQLQPKACKESLHMLAKFLLSHTLNIVLTVQWLNYNTQYYILLDQGIKECMKIYATDKEFQIVCSKLLSLTQNPWSKKIIKKMLKSKTIFPGKKEYDFFVMEESAYIISMRLKKLCEENCSDIALNLTRCYINCCDWAEKESLSMCISDNQKKFVFDIYLSLLFQNDGIEEMSKLLKAMELSDGVNMVSRFSTKVTSKMWENHISIAKLLGTIFLTRCVMLPFEETEHHLRELVQIWSSVYKNDATTDELIATLRRIIKNALSSEHMYFLIDHLSNQFGITMRPYCVEVCIQAINTDLNILERVKTEKDGNGPRLYEISTRVADGFMRLGDQFAENLHVARECVLTSFSIMPSHQGFNKIEEMARASGYEVLDTGQWKCPSHPSADPNEDVLIKCDLCGDYKSELKLNQALKQANSSLIEAFKMNNMGLPSVLCDDLVVIIFCARYQMLSWLQTWRDLQRLCVMYLNDPDGTKNLTTELKFVEIDYTPFMIKQEKADYCSEEEVIDMEFDYFIPEKSVKKRPRVLSSSEDEQEEDNDDGAMLCKNETTSDPNVLQTLKSYRRNIKKFEGEMSYHNGTAALSQCGEDNDPLALDANDGTSADAEYEFDTSSAHNLNLSRVPQPYGYNTHMSSLSGTNSFSCNSKIEDEDKLSSSPKNDPPQEYHQQEFGNFQHDAENYEIDRELSMIHWNATKKYKYDCEMLQVSAKNDQKNGESSHLSADVSQQDDGDIYLSKNDDSRNSIISLNDDNAILGSEPNNNTKQTTNASQDLLLESLKRKYNIKECSIFLTRYDERKEDLNSNIKHQEQEQQLPLTRESTKVKKLKMFVDNKTKTKRKSSENVVQSQLVKYYNINIKYPPQLNNRRILRNKNDAGRLEALKKKLLIGPNKMNPVVVLKRLEESCVQTFLSRVPGVNDTDLFRPIDTDRIVNVVQVAGGRSTSTVQSPNTQTSTQVSPHIQRIGQPRNEKNDSTNSEREPATTTSTKATTNTYTISKPTSTQSSTLINILSQQIIRPTHSNNNARNRSGPLINIISQPTIKSANTTSLTRPITTTVTSEPTQLNNTTTRIIATSSEQQQQIINQIVNTTNRTGGTVKAVVGTSNSEPGRIVQFICKSTDGKLIPVTSFPSNRLVKVGTTNQSITNAAIVTQSDTHSNLEDTFAKLVVPNNNVTKKTESNELSETLPKFQQAFGKSSVYQNNVDSTNNVSTITNNTDNTNTDKNKPMTQLTQAKATLVTTTVNVQPLQGSVIYTRQMPVGQTINLIQQNRGQVFRIATTNADHISLVKDTTIHSKMSALLAAALQGKPKNDTTTDDNSTTETAPITTTTTARLQIARPGLVQTARIVKPVLQIPSNVIRSTPQTPTNLSSTTLEQLREFDMVYKQVKERSSTSTPADTSGTSSETESSPQRISVTYLNQSQKINCAPVVVVSSYSNLQPAASPALSVASQGSSSPCVTPAPTPTPVLPKVAANKSSKGKSVKNPPMHAAKTSPIPKPQQKPQEDEHTTQRIFDILAEYAEQLRNSPDLNNKPAPRRRSNPPTNPSQNSKRKKSSSSKKSGQCSSLSTEADLEDPRTVGSEDSSCGVVQLSMQDDDQTPTTASTSESNDSTNHVAPRQQLILTDSTHNQTRNLIIADSSNVGEALKMPNTALLVPGNYIMPVSMVKGGQQIAVVSGGSKILATVPARSGPNMLLFQSFLNQNRKTNVPSVKYSTIQPISGISSHSLTGVSAQPPVILPPPSHGIGTVTLGQPIAIKKLDDSDTRIQNTTEQLLLTISQQPRDQNCVISSDEGTPQPDSSTSVVATKLDIDENTAMSDNSSEKAFVGFQKQIATPIATPVIAQTVRDDNGQNEEKTDNGNAPIMTLDMNPPFVKAEQPKNEERVQSVLVSAGTSNGPMLSHSPPQYKQSDCNNSNEQTKDEFIRNGGKRNEKVQHTVFSVHGKVKKTSIGSRMDREVQQMCMQRRQAAIERELRLQKSLSEECEDLGVDEPSTSDLFPEALLYDANNSPGFDQTSQDNLKRSQLAEKEENKLSLFSDDDFIFEASQYEANDNQLCYEEVVDSRILSNGQGGTTEDSTLLQTCTSMSDVTLSSPISPENYRTSTSPPLNKYMHKYTNKKKNEKVPKPQDNWSGEVSSSEDTMGSTELHGTGADNCKHDHEQGHDDIDEEELSDGSFKVVRIAVSKTRECNSVHCFGEEDDIDIDCPMSGRGARKAIKKTCSCCNGNEDANTINLNINANTHTTTLNANSNVANVATRKRPANTIQQHTNSPHKKAFPSNKKR